MSHAAVWVEYVRLASFAACVIGLYVLYNDASTQEDLGEANWNLMAFGFGYWLLNCVAHGVEQWLCPDCSAVWLSMKFLNLFSMLLTFSCVLALPLNQVAARNQPEEP